MATPLDTSIGIVAYLALFAGVGVIFVFVNLLIGKFVRPDDPHEEKKEIYECGEPTVGSSFVQFDLRFYVVALVFIIFDVEVAFLFPWATVYGKLQHLVHGPTELVQMTDAGIALTPTAEGVYREMGLWAPRVPEAETASAAEQMLRQGVVAADGALQFAGFEQMMWWVVLAAGLFFVVLLVGFAYEWRTGALDWVRSAINRPPPVVERGAPVKESPQESVLSV